MASQADQPPGAVFVEPRSPAWLRYAGYGLAALLLIVGGWFVYRALTDVDGVKIFAPPELAIEMLPPPPPPPPPPEPKIKPPEPTETPTPKPEPAEAAKPEAAAVTMDASAQAGNDAFGVNAGSGKGSGAPGGTGTCEGTNCGRGGFGDGFYTGYLSSVLQERIQDNRKVNRLLFTAEFAISVDASGRVIAAELVKSTGDAKRDALIREALINVKGLNAPPATLRFPQKITVRGRKAFG